ELNERLAAHDTADDARRIASRAQPVGQDFALEAPLLRPLPAERFETGVTLSARVDRHARITVRQCQYSVPARLIGQRVRVLLRATGLVVFDGRRQVAVHDRATVRGTQTLVLDHYLEVLARKPGAMPGATALAQARAAGSFSTAHEAWWAAARAANGDAGGTRALVEVLLLHRHLPAAAVTAGLQAALAIGATSPDVVAVEARRASLGQLSGAASGTGPVLTLPVRSGNPTVLTPDQRPLPTVTGYDELLSRRTPSRVDPTPTVTAGEAIS
ncbi:MAG: Mu transposase domain-containing protein, partial [Solirubrobacterales bacterium]